MSPVKDWHQVGHLTKNCRSFDR